MANTSWNLDGNSGNNTARVSIDGEDWYEVGTHAILNKDGRLGLAAVSDGIENPAEFDYLEVKVPNEKN